MTESPDLKAKRNLGTMIALSALLLIGLSLILLAAMVMPQILYILGVVFGMGLIILLHYITWGRWLSKKRPLELDEEENL